MLSSNIIGCYHVIQQVSTHLALWLLACYNTQRRPSLSQIRGHRASAYSRRRTDQLGMSVACGHFFKSRSRIDLVPWRLICTGFSLRSTDEPESGVLMRGPVRLAMGHMEDLF